jgi:hypothetical protein
MTMEAVCILKQEKPDWDTAKKVLSDPSFMRSLEEFDKDNIPVCEADEHGARLYQGGGG